MKRRNFFKSFAALLGVIAVNPFELFAKKSLYPMALRKDKECEISNEEWVAIHGQREYLANEMKSSLDYLFHEQFEIHDSISEFKNGKYELQPNRMEYFMTFYGKEIQNGGLCIMVKFTPTQKPSSSQIDVITAIMERHAHYLTNKPFLNNPT